MKEKDYEDLPDFTIRETSDNVVSANSRLKYYRLIDLSEPEKKEVVEFIEKVMFVFKRLSDGLFADLLDSLLKALACQKDYRVSSDTDRLDEIEAACVDTTDNQRKELLEGLERIQRTTIEKEWYAFAHNIQQAIRVIQEYESNVQNQVPISEI